MALCNASQAFSGALTPLSTNVPIPAPRNRARGAQTSPTSRQRRTVGAPRPEKRSSAPKHRPPLRRPSQAGKSRPRLPMPPPEAVRGLNCHDVSFGRGKQVTARSGNVNFRKLVWKYKAMYRSVPNTRKLVIARALKTEIETLDPPGRFLEPHGYGKGFFQIVSDARAMEKCKQALREKPEKLNDPQPNTEGENSKGDNDDNQERDNDDISNLQSLLLLDPQVASAEVSRIFQHKKKKRESSVTSKRKTTKAGKTKTKSAKKKTPRSSSLAKTAVPARRPVPGFQAGKSRRGDVLILPKPAQWTPPFLFPAQDAHIALGHPAPSAHPFTQNTAGMFPPVAVPAAQRILFPSRKEDLQLSHDQKNNKVSMDLQSHHPVLGSTHHAANPPARIATATPIPFSRNHYPMAVTPEPARQHCLQPLLLNDNEGQPPEGEEEDETWSHDLLEHFRSLQVHAQSKVIDEEHNDCNVARMPFRKPPCPLVWPQAVIASAPFNKPVGASCAAVEAVRQGSETVLSPTVLEPANSLFTEEMDEGDFVKNKIGGDFAVLMNGSNSVEPDGPPETDARKRASKSDTSHSVGISLVENETDKREKNSHCNPQPSSTSQAPQMAFLSLPPLVLKEATSLASGDSDSILVSMLPLLMRASSTQSLPSPPRPPAVELAGNSTAEVLEELDAFDGFEEKMECGRSTVRFSQVKQSSETAQELDLHCITMSCDEEDEKVAGVEQSQKGKTQESRRMDFSDLSDFPVIDTAKHSFSNVKLSQSEIKESSPKVDCNFNGSVVHVNEKGCSWTAQKDDFELLESQDFYVSKEETLARQGNNSPDSSGVSGTMGMPIMMIPNVGVGSHRTSMDTRA